MQDDDSVGISDQRLRGFFIVDNDIFSNTRNLSPYALLVYCVLCRLSYQRAQEIKVSRSYISKLARISSGSVSKATAELEAEGLIEVHRIREGSINKPSLYILKNVSSSPSCGDGHVVTVTMSTHSTDALPSTEDFRVQGNGSLFNPGPESQTLNGKTGEAVNIIRERLFPAYLEVIGKNPNTYTLTSARLDKGVARLKECLKKTAGDVDKAILLFCDAIDALGASDWHNGRDKATQGKKYNDWIDNFTKNSEQFEKWLDKASI
jgi:hypothetical protein